MKLAIFYMAGLLAVSMAVTWTELLLERGVPVVKRDLGICEGAGGKDSPLLCTLYGAYLVRNFIGRGVQSSWRMRGVFCSRKTMARAHLAAPAFRREMPPMQRRSPYICWQAGALANDEDKCCTPTHFARGGGYGTNDTAILKQHNGITIMAGVNHHYGIWWLKVVCVSPVDD